MVSKTEWMRQSRARKKALGLCMDCGNPMDRKDRSFCNTCLAKRREYGLSRKEKMSKYLHELRESRKAQNLCRDCAKPLTSEEHYYCNQCREKQRIYSLNYKRKNKKPDTPEIIQSRREKTRILRMQRIAIGLCPYCGDAMDRLDGLRCNKCREQYRIYKKDYYERTKKSKKVKE